MNRIADFSYKEREELFIVALREVNLSESMAKRQKDMGTLRNKLIKEFREQHDGLVLEAV